MAQGSSNPTTDLKKIAGTEVVSGGTNGTLAIGGIQAHDAAASGNKPVLIGGVANTSSPPAVSSGDVSQLWVTTNGALNVADGGSSLSIDDAGGSITVDGTVAATQSGTWNVGTVTTVTGVTTVTSLTELNGQAIAMGTGVRTAGTQRVTIATDDTVNIGSIGGAITPGTGANNLGKPVDGAAGAADVGVLALAVRDDALTTLTPADDDYTQLRVTSQGRLWTSAVVDTALPAGTNNIGDVDVASLPGTVEADITAIKTAVETLDNAVSGNELQVDIVASLPAGTNSIGNVNTISAVTTVSTVTNLSQLGGTAIAMGTGVRTAGTQRVTIATDDVVPISDNAGSLTVDAPVGTPVFVRLSDGTSAITNLATNLAQVGGTATVTGGTNGTLAIGGVQAHDAAVSGNKPVLIGGVANTSTPTAVASGDVSQLWTTTTGALNVADGGSSLSIDDSGGSLTVDAPVGTPVFVRLSDGSAAITTLPVSLASLPSLAAGTNSIGNVNTVSAVTTVSTVTNLSQLGGAAIAMGSGVRTAGTQRVTIATDDIVPASQSGTWNINTLTSITNAVAVTDNNGSLTVDGTVNAAQSGTWNINTLTSITNTVGTNLAQVGGTSTVSGGTAGTLAIGGVQDHDAAVSGNKPVLTGGVANSSLPTAVSSGDVSRYWTNLNGAQATVPYPEGVSAFAPTNATTTALASSLVVKAGAGTLYMITGYSNRASAQFIHVYNATSLPADGGVPVMIFTVPAQSNFSLDLGMYGRHFTTGIVVGNSTTAATKTIGSADCWFDVQYK